MGGRGGFESAARPIERISRTLSKSSIPQQKSLVSEASLPQERRPPHFRFPMRTHPRRTQCEAGADEPFVTHAE
jgi:hypothetical protein